ncbi:hypothetical protein HDZ31DRAFT_72199 [Schizophyllum fasciatum]
MTAASTLGSCVVDGRRRSRRFRGSSPPAAVSSSSRAPSASPSTPQEQTIDSGASACADHERGANEEDSHRSSKKQRAIHAGETAEGGQGQQASQEVKLTAERNEVGPGLSQAEIVKPLLGDVDAEDDAAHLLGEEDTDTCISSKDGEDDEAFMTKENLADNDAPKKRKRDEGSDNEDSDEIARARKACALAPRPAPRTPPRQNAGQPLLPPNAPARPVRHFVETPGRLPEPALDHYLSIPPPAGPRRTFSITLQTVPEADSSRRQVPADLGSEEDAEDAF